MIAPVRPQAGDIALLVLTAALLAALWPFRAAPPLEHHAWRQVLAANVSRGYRCGQPLFRPRVDACGDRDDEGVVAMELPLYAWTMARAGALFGPHGGERAVSLAAALGALLGLAAVARRLTVRMDGMAASGGGAAAAGTAAAAPFFVFYSGTLLPDGPAWALGLAGAALTLAGDERRSLRAVSAGSLVLSLGLATKLVAAPLLALTAALLLARVAASSPEEREGAAARLAAHLALAVALPALWYLVQVPRLRAAETCHLFFFGVTDPWAHLSRALPAQVHARLGALLGEHGRLALYLLAAPAAAALRRRAAALGLLWAAAAVFWAMLGWHRDHHDYDGLVLLPPAALTAGAGVAWLLSRVTWRWRAAAAVALPLALALPAHRWARTQVERWRWHETELPALPLLAHELDLLLPPGAGIGAPGQGQDPRLAYFAARPALNADRAECRAPSRFDCAVVLQPGAPVCGRAASSAFLPDKTVTCGLAGGSLAAARARLAASISPGDGRLVPGLGRYLGFDASHRDFGSPRVDLWFEAAGGSLDLSRVSAPAAPQAARGPVPAGALVAVRVPLPEPGGFRLTLDGSAVEGVTEDRGALEARCVARP
jgi:hypothetical protein